MVLQSCLRGVIVLTLTEGPFINNATVTSILEYAWCDPRLTTSEKRALEATFESLTSRTSQPPRLTPRTFLEP